MKKKRKKHEHVISVTGAKRAKLAGFIETDVCTTSTQDMATEEEQQVRYYYGKLICHTTHGQHKNVGIFVDIIVQVFDNDVRNVDA